MRRWPHLQFQVSDSVYVLAGEGVPFAIDRCRIKLPSNEWAVRRGEFPWGDTAVIDFGSPSATAP